MDWKEEHFWMMVVEEIENHFRKYPHLKDRFENIQLYCHLHSMPSN